MGIAWERPSTTMVFPSTTMDEEFARYFNDHLAA